MDLKSGGAESVFARLITENMPKNPGDYPVGGRMQILCDLELVERVGYIYSKDEFGSKEMIKYYNRPSVLELQMIARDTQIRLSTMKYAFATVFHPNA